jgi:hypothetical protein
MAGLVWGVPAEGGFMYSDELSDVLRQQVQPLTKFRQLCDAQDGSKKGLNRGDKYNSTDVRVPSGAILMCNRVNSGNISL